MNGLEGRHRTLGELMTELRSRLGFMVQGPAAKTNDLVIKSFLQEAHEYVFGELEPPAMRKKTTITVKPGSFMYDWNNDKEDESIDPSRVISIWLIESDAIRRPMHQGITESHRSLTDRQTPQRYDNLSGQMEIWPIPDREYEVLIEYTAERGRFDRSSDRCSVPDRLVFLYALATAKAHYRHPDSQASAATFTNMLNKAKAQQKENRRYFFSGFSDSAHSPQVVKTADGYRLKG